MTYECEMVTTATAIMFHVRLRLSLLVDGNWSDWNEWSACGGGEERRTRTCANPPPAFGGRGGEKCPGESEETRPCNEAPCLSKYCCFFCFFLEFRKSLIAVDFLQKTF